MNTFFLVSGPSGSGKTVIMRAALENEVVSFTTREIRKGEVDGVDYNFITKDAFVHQKTHNGLIEDSEYSGNYYGVTWDEFNKRIKNGPAFNIVDFNGMLQFRHKYEKTIPCVSIFIYTPVESAIENMKTRGDSFDNITNRISTHSHEMKNSIYYDYVIQNPASKLDSTIHIVKAIVDSRK